MSYEKYSDTQLLKAKEVAEKNWSSLYSQLESGFKADREVLALAMKKLNDIDDYICQKEYEQYQKKMKEYHDHCEQHICHQ